MTVSWRGRFALDQAGATGGNSMVIALLIAGIGAILAGILAVVYGFLLELSFGNTLILAGVVAVCSGIIVLALALVVRELRNIAGRLALGTAEEERTRPALPPIPPLAAREAGQEAYLFSRDQAARTAAEAAPTPPSAPPWREHAASRERPRQEAPVPPPEEAEPAPPRRRNLLFSSNMRKERERGQTGAGESTAPERPSSVGPETSRPGFETAWPKAERPRASEFSPRRPGRPPSAAQEAEAGEAEEPVRSVEPAQSEEQPAVTVIKSGVVDGMAYSLYSDGSIEAQMPEGMMRFASIDELRAHLDQRT
jgi:hypothetical protein